MSTSIAVIVPTRGRRKNAERLVRAWLKTHAQADLCFAVDMDDTETYEGMLVPTNASIYVTERMPLGGILNFWADRFAPLYEIIGFMGDDHLPTTMLWDQVVRNMLIEPPGIAYGDDGLQGPNLPTAVFMTADIIETLGYMAPPGIEHLYLDTVWKLWGTAMNRLYYNPELRIEHLHPQADKAKWDEGYHRVNSGDQWAHDELAYSVYRANGLPVDIKKLRSLCD